jgi:hypothetical protein
MWKYVPPTQTFATVCGVLLWTDLCCAAIPAQQYHFDLLLRAFGSHTCIGLAIQEWRNDEHRRQNLAICRSFDIPGQNMFGLTC